MIDDCRIRFFLFNEKLMLARRMEAVINVKIKTIFVLGMCRDIVGNFLRLSYTNVELYKINKGVEMA